jgi:DNA-directed RNA polymerase II subunit RPB7
LQNPLLSGGGSMFFHMELTKELLLYPKHFGPNIRNLLREKLIYTVEGSCSGQHGFVVAVTDVVEIGKGRIREGGGLATFPIQYNAIVFRPFKGEVFDAIVTQVNKLGFFAQVGPLQVFVSKHMIPEDMVFDAQGALPAYVSQVSDQQPQRIAKDSEVRLRVIATRVDAAEIFAIGTIKDEYLGLLD